MAKEKQTTPRNPIMMNFADEDTIPGRFFLTDAMTCAEAKAAFLRAMEPLFANSLIRVTGIGTRKGGELFWYVQVGKNPRNGYYVSQDSGAIRVWGFRPEGIALIPEDQARSVLLEPQV